PIAPGPPTERLSRSSIPGQRLARWQAGRGCRVWLQQLACEGRSRRVVGLSRAEQRQLRYREHVPRHRDLGVALTLRRGDKRAALERRRLGQQYQPFATARVAERDDSVTELRRCSLGDTFSHSERDHFAADLGEALSPPSDRD